MDRYQIQIKKELPTDTRLPFSQREEKIFLEGTPILLKLKGVASFGALIGSLHRGPEIQVITAKFDKEELPSLPNYKDFIGGTIAFSACTTSDPNDFLRKYERLCIIVKDMQGWLEPGDKSSSGDRVIRRVLQIKGNLIDG